MYSAARPSTRKRRRKNRGKKWWYCYLGLDRRGGMVDTQLILVGDPRKGVKVIEARFKMF